MNLKFVGKPWPVFDYFSHCVSIYFIKLYLVITKPSIMGLFDFFKKKKAQAEEMPAPDLGSFAKQPEGKSINDIYAEKQKADVNPTPQADNETFSIIKRYDEYIICFINMQLNGNYSPIAAYETAEGELRGYLYFSDDLSYNLSIEEVIGKMESEFEAKLSLGSIKSYTIFYHSQFNYNNNHKVAYHDGEFRAISVKYKTVEGLEGYAALPYSFTEDELTFKGFAGFSPEQNNALLNTQLEQGKDYFQDKVEIKQELIENEAGIKIKEVNQASLGNMWRGILGYQFLETPHGNQLFKEYMALSMAGKEKDSNDRVTVREQAYGGIIFRAVKTRDGKTATVYPVVKTSYIIPVEIKQIDQWVHTGSLEAVISGSGRNTFGLKFFATDYALNSQKYHYTKNLHIALSGIALVLDESSSEAEKVGDATLSPDFTTYIPNKELSYLGCFDFIGKLEKFREVKLLEDQSVEGYIIKVKLINEEEIADFFSIDMFVNKENMRFSKLTEGMKLAGLFQLLGEIADE